MVDVDLVFYLLYARYDSGSLRKNLFKGIRFRFGIRTAGLFAHAASDSTYFDCDCDVYEKIYVACVENIDGKQRVR